jgi:predicted ATP-dependent endonuclease of OLD family
MIQDDLLTTINLVTKDIESGTQVVNVHTILADWEPKEKNRLLQMQNISSYIFAERVLLVEGLSDRLIFKKIAPALNPDWNFDQSGIPILQVGGKGDLPLFKNFLDALGIMAFVVTDIDAVSRTVGRLSTNGEIKGVKDQLLERALELADGDEFKNRINKRYVEKLADGYQWSKVFENLGQLYTALIDDNELTEEQVGCLEKLLLKAQEDAKKEVLRSDHDDIQKLRLPLVELLLGEDVLLLCGDIEDYYPNGSSTAKVKSALEFNPNDHERDELCSCFASVEDSTDVEIFLARVFPS